MGKGLASQYIQPAITMCTECFHREVCGDKDYLTENNCFFFLDKNQCVVLPCKVGDTVYWVSNFGKAVNQGKVTVVKISGFGIDLEMATPENLLFKREAERVFLTRSEAEQALKISKEDALDA